MRVDIEDFTDKSISRVFIAKSVEEAERVADLLESENIDYAVAQEQYLALLSMAARDGVAFYVLAGQESFCRKMLKEKGLTGGLTVEE